MGWEFCRIDWLIGEWEYEVWLGVCCGLGVWCVGLFGLWVNIVEFWDLFVVVGGGMVFCLFSEELCCLL